MIERLRKWYRQARVRETIGPDECPIIYRWTLLGQIDEENDDQAEEPPPFKLLLHRFVGSADDRHVHDHPRPFWTLVLRGGYDDIVQCPDCAERRRLGTAIPGWPLLDAAHALKTRVKCPRCGGYGGEVPGDRMRAGMLRFRPALYRHRTVALPGGAWTLVLMGPIRRPWGFWRHGEWWPWRLYERVIGSSFRCEETFETKAETDSRIYELERKGYIVRDQEGNWQEVPGA